MSSTKIKVAAVHAAPVYMNKRATIQKVVKIIEGASKDGVDLLVFPETFVPGYPYFIECYPPLKQVAALTQYIDQSVVARPDSEDMRPLVAACQKYKVTISLGVSERTQDGHTLFNSQINIDSDGVMLGVHRKLQPTYVERAVWAQGSGCTLSTYQTKAGYNLSGLCCWEHTMNGARQALIEQGQQIHAGAWPALSTMSGFESCANSQIEALMKNHALTAQVFVVCASNYIDESCLKWMEDELGPQELVKAGGGWSAVIHPFCLFLDGPYTEAKDMLVNAEIDLADIAGIKVWIDAKGHYKRPEVLHFELNREPMWDDDEAVAGPKVPDLEDEER